MKAQNTKHKLHKAQIKHRAQDAKHEPLQSVLALCFRSLGLYLCFVFLGFVLSGLPQTAYAGLIVQRPLYIGLDDGLVGYWSFDGQDMSGERAYDRSGNSNTGLLTNGPVRTTGKLGQALKFDGSDDFVNAGSASSLDSLGPVTFSAWIFPRTLGETSLGTIVAKSGNSGYLDFRFSSTGEFVLRKDYNTTDLERDGGTVVLNVWQHVVATWDGSATAANIHIYVNGVEVAYIVTTDGATTKNSDVNNDLIIGNNSVGGRTFNGLIDEVRIYNRVLSPEEIKRLYNIGATLKINKPLNTGSLSNGLVGYWSFDGKDMAGERAYDLSGNSNTGLLTGGPVRTIGKIGQALSFDGSNDYVDVGDKDSLEPSNKRISVSAWVLTRVTTANKRAVTKGTEPSSTTNGWYLGLGSSASSFVFSVFAGPIFGVVDTPAGDSTSFSVNQWHHLVGLWDGSNVLLYVDGVLKATSASQTNNYTNNSSPARIGTNGDNTNYWDGLIDDVRIYNRALSPEEIKRLYNIGATLKINKPVNTGSLSNGLVGHWSFDASDMAGERAYDRSGNANTGLLTNGPARTTGKLGQALSFDGSNDYVDASNLSYNANYPLTVTLWIFPRTSGGTNGILHYGDSASTPHLLLRQATDNSLRVYVQDVYTNYGSLTINAWNHIAIVRGASGTGDVYINGVDVGNITATSASPAQNARWWIGRDSFSASQYFNDLIDDVRIYNRALSPEEVKRLYNTGR